MSDFYNKYPYTDFHELNLDWVIERVKKLTEDWLATHEEWVGVQQDWADTEQAWIDFKAYVENYLANIDVQDEIDQKIDEMIINGQFETIIKPIVETQTANTAAAWLTDHVTPVGSAVVVDDSFTIHGAAADSRTVGWRGMITELTIHAGNYSAELPDLNSAKTNKIYHLLFANTLNLPANFPPISATGTNMTLITSTGTTTSSVSNSDISQILFTESEIWYRRKTGSGTNDWNSWYKLTLDKANTLQYIGRITASNFSTDLPDLDGASLNSFYVLNFAIGATTLPLHYPEAVNTDTLAALISIGTTGAVQIFYNNNSIYVRHSAGAVYTDWVRISDAVFNFKALDQLTVSNYSTLLPDLDNAAANTEYTGIFAINSTSMPAHWPDSAVKATISNIITIAANAGSHTPGFKTQLFYDIYGIRFRQFSGGVWTDWMSFSKPQYDFIIGTGEKYTTLKDGIAAAIQYPNSRVFVADGTYDLITEFGSSFFANMPQSQQGIKLANGINIDFSSNAYVTCDYTGSNPDVSQYFSPFYFGDGTNIKITGLNLYARNTRYAIHDEMGGNNFTSTHEYVNCNIDFDSTNTTYPQAIGGGLGKSTTIIIRDSYFKSASPNNGGTVSWHNSSNASARGSIVITGCYFESARIDGEGGNFRFGYYGPSAALTPIKVSNCSMDNNIVMRYETSDTSTPQNAVLYAFNNEIR